MLPGKPSQDLAGGGMVMVGIAVAQVVAGGGIEAGQAVGGQANKVFTQSRGQGWINHLGQSMNKRLTMAIIGGLGIGLDQGQGRYAGQEGLQGGIDGVTD